MLYHCCSNKSWVIGCIDDESVAINSPIVDDSDVDIHISALSGLLSNLKIRESILIDYFELITHYVTNLNLEGGCFMMVIGALPVEHQHDIHIFLKECLPSYHFDRTSYDCFRYCAPTQTNVLIPENLVICTVDSNFSDEWIVKDRKDDFKMVQNFTLNHNRTFKVCSPLLAFRKDEDLTNFPSIVSTNDEFLLDKLRRKKPIGMLRQDWDDGAIGGLWTDPEYRRNGIARTLINYMAYRIQAMEFPKWNGDVVAHVEVSNSASMALFESCGWTRDAAGPLVWLEYYIEDAASETSESEDGEEEPH